MSSKNIMVVGGGVAGMAAAKTLNDHGINVHLVEKKNRFGGNASQWACMATDSCQDCSACLSTEMVDQLDSLPRVTPYLGFEISKIEQTSGQYQALLTGEKEKTVEVDQIIVATGFSPAQPSGLLKETWQSNSQVVTTVELNQMLQNNDIGKMFPNTDHPKIGFVQCVGSRNREIGKDYCSQVCCQISLRHINKLIYLYPDADISLFYIDLQIIGKETRSRFKALSDNVSLIQGVPFEVFDDKSQGQVSIIVEDSQSASRKAAHFDLLVLSVGVHNNDGIAGLTDMLNIPLDSFGFCRNENNPTSTTVFVAGSAAGPVDIQTAKHQGIACAQKVIQGLAPENSFSGSVAIVGDGTIAENMADSVIAKGFDVTMFSLGKDKGLSKPGLNYIPEVSLHSIQGSAGNLSVLYADAQRTIKKNFLAIVAAESVAKNTAGLSLGLPDGRRYSLDQFLDMQKQHSSGISPDIPDAIAFWLDYSGPELKVSSRRVLLNAIDLADQGKQISIIMDKMLVHGLKGQQIYDMARKKGVRFFRTDTSDTVQMKMENKKIVCELKETTLGNLDVTFDCDWVVLPDAENPSKNTTVIARVLNEPVDMEGYMQSANVRHRLTQSPRKGLFYLGSCHGEPVESGDQGQSFELDLILSSICDIASNSQEPATTQFQINTDKCKKCLTCYRTCPHGAIVLNDNTPVILDDACFSCGLCLSSCPALAIESDLFSDDIIIEPVEENTITVFACERSGALAAKGLFEHPQLNIQKVSCVCRIGENIMLKALEKGSRKIVLAGCHPGNCRSMEGSTKADKRAAWLSQLPGVNSSDVVWYPVAANESKKFEHFVTCELLGRQGN